MENTCVEGTETVNQYEWCPGCRFETRRNEDGTCGFCVPERTAPVEDHALDACQECGTPFPPVKKGLHRKKFCSRLCQKKSWMKGPSAEKARERRAEREKLRKRDRRREHAA